MKGHHISYSCSPFPPLPHLLLIPPFLSFPLLSLSLLLPPLPLFSRTRKYIWHGMWSLVLLLYAPLMHTCATLLHCPYLPIGRGEMANETYVRGTLAPNYVVHTPYSSFDFSSVCHNLLKICPSPLLVKTNCLEAYTCMLCYLLLF